MQHYDKSDSCLSNRDYTSFRDRLEEIQAVKNPEKVSKADAVSLLQDIDRMRQEASKEARAYESMRRGCVDAVIARAKAEAYADVARLIGNRLLTEEGK